MANLGIESQAIAQTGLAFTRGPFDRERYEQLRELSARIFHFYTGTSVDRIVDLFARETGYATPKLEEVSRVFRTLILG